jgi:hypothetical protein
MALLVCFQYMLYYILVYYMNHFLSLLDVMGVVVEDRGVFEVTRKSGGEGGGKLVSKEPQWCGFLFDSGWVIGPKTRDHGGGPVFI